MSFRDRAAEIARQERAAAERAARARQAWAEREAPRRAEEARDLLAKFLGIHPASITILQRPRPLEDVSETLLEAEGLTFAAWTGIELYETSDWGACGPPHRRRGRR